MAKRKRARASARKTETLTLRLPVGVWEIIEEAAKLAGLTTDQLASAILALRLVTQKDKPK